MECPCGIQEEREDAIENQAQWGGWHILAWALMMVSYVCPMKITSENKARSQLCAAYSPLSWRGFLSFMTCWEAEGKHVFVSFSMACTHHRTSTFAQALWEVVFCVPGRMDWTWILPPQMMKKKFTVVLFHRVGDFLPES